LRVKGFDVQVEAPRETGGAVDLVVHTEDGPRAIEIETGKSDAKANIEKCQKAGVPVIAVATDREVERRLREDLPTDISVLSVLDSNHPPWE